MTDWWKLFYVGKTKFNTGIKVKLLQDFVAGLCVGKP